MITAARKPSTLDPSPKSRLGHKHALSQFSINSSSPINYNAFIQRKSTCACGGGCSRCSGVIQPKLTIGQANDKYRQEADRVTDKVMRMSQPQIQRQPLEEEEEILQTKTTPAQFPSLSAATHFRIQSLKGDDQPLPKAERIFFEPRFHRDFSQVRVHTGTQAAGIAKAVNARAFTLGRDVVFGAGQYRPHSNEGKRLLAHELTHVVQQKNLKAFQSGKILGMIPHISNSNDKRTKTIQFYQTLNNPMIQFQRFRGCTPGITGAAMTQDEIDNFLLGARMAADLMVIFAEDAVRSIRDGTGSAAERAALTNHFGAPTPAQFRTILNRFAIISRRLSSDRLFICNTARSAYCTRGWCAYTDCPGRGHLTHICPSFFQDPYPCQEPDTVSAMIHEAAHAAGACSDVYPGAGYPPPANTHNNSPSYAGFARAVF